MSGNTGYFQVENIIIDGYTAFNKEEDKYEHKDLFESAHEKLIFFALTRYANNNDGIAFPSVSTLAEVALCGITTVKKYIKKLAAKGYITITHRPRANKDNDSNIYTVKKLSEIYKDIFLPQSAGDGGTATDDYYKEQDIKNYEHKDHDSKTVANSSAPVPDTFEHLFRKFGIGYTNKNKQSVKALLKKMKPSQVATYLEETYNNILASPGVINISGLFSAKIARQERQMTKAARQAIAMKEKEIERQKEIEKRITCVDPLAVFNHLPPMEKFRVEKEALDLFITQTSADEKILKSMRDNVS